jgi:glycosyltransferase involved in cell wall biosynthesis
MIFVDVTGACKSPKNTGIQRITRHIFRHLTERVPTTAICWNAVGNRYQHLGRREREVLEQPFQVLSRPTSRPEIRGEHFLAELHRQFFRKSMSLQKELAPGDVFLIPDIYRDGRLAELPKVIAGTRARTVETWPAELNPEEQSPPSRPRGELIVCVGTFEPRKNQITLLRAAEKLWGSGLTFQLELIGRSTSYFGRKVIAEVRRLRRAKRAVRWSKHVDDQTLHRAYRDCRFTVYPSLMEGFGLPIAESLLHGKPCICGGNGALGEVARDGGCLIVDQTSVDALAEGIKTLLLDRQFYARLSDEARARKFRSWSDYIDKLLTHLQPADCAGAVGACLPGDL